MSAEQKFAPSGLHAEPAGADVAAASTATRRVLDALDRAAIPFSLKILPDGVRTAEEIAENCDCDVNFIVHSTVFRGKATKKPMLLLHSAASTLNDKILGQIVGENLQRADADFVLRLTGYPISTIPPLAHLNRFPVMLDGSLMRFARVWCHAGTEAEIVSVPTLVLARAISARIVRLEP